ncbi:MAG: hypothetical protein NTV31_12640 [Bacteroidia bacterium]|nr:hypothetical protein [Bacteroidia bacterium]
MKGGSLFKKIIYSSWFLAGIPAILIILLLPPLGSKYTISVTSADKNVAQSLYSVASLIYLEDR